jgi:proteic killer suppression protein
MIESFKHKGLQELFEKSRTSKLPQERLKKIKMVLAVLDAAQDLRDLNIPAFRLHKLKKPPLDGYYSIDISGNYRIVFWFEDGKVSEVDYLDTH